MIGDRRGRKQERIQRTFADREVARCRGGGWGGEEEEAEVEEKAEKEAEEDAEADEKVEVLCSSSSHQQIHIISSSLKEKETENI